MNLKNALKGKSLYGGDMSDSVLAYGLEPSTTLNKAKSS